MNFLKTITVFTVLSSIGISPLAAYSQENFKGIVSSASPEATNAGIQVLKKGGNAIDAAVAISLALGVSEPAGSGIAGQTVMLIQPKDGEPFVIHGTTWSPANIPDNVTKSQLAKGRTASTVPSTLKVLSLAHQKFGSGEIDWSTLVLPAIELAKNGVEIGPFRQRAFRFYGDDLKKQTEANNIFIKVNGTNYQVGEVLKQPILANTLQRLAKDGAEDFYSGKIAQEIAKDMRENGGWITADDLKNFPEPRIIKALSSTYRGHEVVTLPPPFGGWVVLQILNSLEQSNIESINQDDSNRRLALLNAMRIGHSSRKYTPVSSFTDYNQDISQKISKEEAKRLVEQYKKQTGGETTNFSVVDNQGNVVAVTQSIDSYFGSKTVHPTLGFLYNNYMQSFRLEDDGTPFVLKAREMPLSSMSATIVKKGDQPVLVLGSPGSARIISAVAQVSSYWIDVNPSMAKAVDAYRVHLVPDDKAYIEGPVIENSLLIGMGNYGLSLYRPAYGVSDSQYDPYFGGVHALAFENGKWTGAADPRRDGAVGIAN